MEESKLEKNKLYNVPFSEIYLEIFDYPSP